MSSKRSRRVWGRKTIASKTSSQPASTRKRLTYLFIAAIFAWFYVQLGHAVSAQPPGQLDRAFEGWTGVATPLAIVFTISGLLPALVAVGLLALIAAWFAPAWRARAIFAVVLDLVAWKVSDFTKELFHRPRPSHYVWHQETSFSYSSGHATDALVVYGLWAFFIWKSELPQPLRGMLAGALTVWALGVSWSRLSLGVHFASDVIGGWLLGAALLFIAFALYEPSRA